MRIKLPVKRVVDLQRLVLALDNVQAMVGETPKTLRKGKMPLRHGLFRPLRNWPGRRISGET
jgi:hypothetical protein